MKKAPETPDIYIHLPPYDGLKSNSLPPSKPAVLPPPSDEGGGKNSFIKMFKMKKAPCGAFFILPGALFFLLYP